MTQTVEPAPALSDLRADFNTAGMSPMLRRVSAAGEQALAQRSRPWTIGLREWFGNVEELRSSVAQLIGVAADAVALVPATSHGLAAVARNLEARAGDRVLVLADGFPSNH